MGRRQKIIGAFVISTHENNLAWKTCLQLEDDIVDLGGKYAAVAVVAEEE
jgi:hypothetical protein